MAHAYKTRQVALTSWKAFTWYAGALNASFAGAAVLILGGSGGTGTLPWTLVSFRSCTHTNRLGLVSILHTCIDFW